MASSTLFFLVFVVSFLPFIPTMSQTLEEEFPQATCGAFDSSNPDSINDILSSISSTSINSGFLYNSSNQNSDDIELVGLCREDLQEDGCLSCLNDSAIRIRRSCPSKSDAILWNLNCTLRYASQKIYGTLDISDTVSFRSSSGASNCSNETLYEEQFLELLSNLQTKAAAGGLRKMAVGNLSTGSDTSYVLVQCTPDLSEQQCRFCLNNIYGKNISSSCDRTREVIFNPSCNYRRDDHNFLDMSSDSSSPQPAPLPTAEGRRKNFAVWKVVLIVILAIGSIIFLTFVIVYMSKRKRNRGSEVIDGENGSLKALQGRRFGIREIRAATNNLSVKLGKGGFGEVYEGTLRNEQKIAVKKLLRENGDSEFVKEAKVLAQLRHKNLVDLLGYCYHRTERFLIFEFMPNSSLENWIFDSDKRADLGWERRYAIIKGIAKGLRYLHEELTEKVIHLDIKAPNILLDAQMEPKIADFGLARLFGVDKTGTATNRIVGTNGYMAPEYLREGNVSVKADVYSFGVFILEIVSGRKVNTSNEFLLSLAWKSWGKGTPEQIIDPSLDYSTNMAQIRCCIYIGLLCVQEDINLRPAMGTVVSSLESLSPPQENPSKPGYVSLQSVDVPERQSAPVKLPSNGMMSLSTEDPHGRTV